MRTYLCLLSMLASSLAGFGQTYDDLLNRAGDALGKKSYCEALGHFEKAFTNLAQAGPYDLAFGAVAAAHCQKPDLAITWLNESLQKGLGQQPGEAEQLISDPVFAVLHEHPGWPAWTHALRGAQRQHAQQQQQRQAEWLATTTRNRLPLPTPSGHYATAPAGFARYVSRADTTNVPYLVHVPATYTPQQPLPLIVYLHGGVANQEAFQDQDPDIANEPIFRATPNALVLYPFGKKTFGWVGQEAAFRHVLTIIGEVMSRYRIDPKRVYLGGMSNGATAAFWYIANAPARFAGFFAFSPSSTLPLDATTPTHPQIDIRIVSVSAEDDTVYTYESVRQTHDRYVRLLPGWSFQTVKTGGHGFLYGPDGVAILQQTLAQLVSPSLRHP